MWKSAISKGDLNTRDKKQGKTNTKKPHKQKTSKMQRKQNVENNRESKSLPQNM